jgi:prepilin-type N-terminal cleavage/methylation domain-containing protein
MNRYRKQNAFTFIEMLVVIAIITILSAVLLKVGARIDTQGKERQTKATIDTIDSALEQFAASGFEYKYYESGHYTFDNPPYDDSWLKFPPDCNGFDAGEVADEIYYALTGGNYIVNIYGDYDIDYSSSAVMYFFLNRNVKSRDVLKNIDKSFLVNKESAGANAISIEIDKGSGSPLEAQPFYWVVDAWGKPLRYDYYRNYNEYDGGAVNTEDCYDSRRSFPLITSAGADGDFDTQDDITNQK